MSAADGPDQSLRRSARTSVAPSVTVNPRTRPTHRARSEHGGLFVPKPTTHVSFQGFAVPDLARIRGSGDSKPLMHLAARITTS
jgi:hypothetical protein